MAWKNIVILLALLALTTDVRSQFYDVFQGFQPFIQTYHTTRRPFQRPQQNTNRKLIGDSYSTSNERQSSSEEARQQTGYERDGYRQTSYERVEPRQTQKPKRKHTTTKTTSIFNLSYYTTPKAVRKSNKKSSHRQFDTDQEFARANVDQDLTDASVPNSNSENRRQWHDESVNNVAGNYYSTRPTVTTTKRNYVTTRPNYVTTRPNYGTSRPNYDTTRRNNVTTKNYYNPNGDSRPNYDTNSLYTTYNPVNKPGVRPANVDVNKPPITNKPPSLAVYPRPTDSSVIRFPEDPDTSPEVTAGIDDGKMSYAERRRYIEMSENMCDKYKSLSVKKVEAIPLLPSPEPVQVNVSTCPPTTVPLVVGGKVVTIQEFPHMALLGWTKIEGGGYSWKCGGSLISDQYVLTASHCAYQDKDDAVVTGAPRVVQLGSNYLDDSGALVVKVLSVIRHPKYTPTRSYYDVALVKMVTPVTFSEVVKPACLGEPPGVGEPIIVTGWGRTEFGGSQSLELRSVSIPVWDIDECHRKLGTSRKMPQGPSRDSQICAGERKGGKDTCQGDSGGPAQIQDGCTWRVVAVTSVGRSCGAPNTPALYATLHKAFIAAHVFAKSETSQSVNRNGDNRNNNRDRHSNTDNNNGNRNINNGNNNRQKNYDTDNDNGNRYNENGNRDRYPNTDNSNGNRNINNGNNNRNRNYDNGNLNSNSNGNNNNENHYNVNRNQNNNNPSNSHYDNVNNRPQISLNYGNDESGYRNNDYNRNQPNAHRNRSPDSYYTDHNIGTTSNGYSNGNEQANSYNNAQGITYGSNSHNYDNNNGNVFNNYRRNGFNNNGNGNNDYATNRHAQTSYGITEEPTFNNPGSWW